MIENISYNNDLLDLKRLRGDTQADDFIGQVFADTVKKSNCSSG